jgi:ubiquinol-cytochrome c reductase cytochrome c subunit
MPVFSDGVLSPQDKKDIISYLKKNEQTPSYGGFTLGSVGPVSEEIREGGEFFRTNCTACHNSVGAGGALPNGRYAPSLKGVSAKHIYEAMLTGPQQMPLFSDEVITPEDKRNVIAYIKSVQDQPTPGIAGGSVGPVSEGMFTFLIGMGGLVGVAVWIGAHGARVKKRSS